MVRGLPAYTIVARSVQHPHMPLLRIDAPAMHINQRLCGLKALVFTHRGAGEDRLTRAHKTRAAFPC